MAFQTIPAERKLITARAYQTILAATGAIVLVSAWAPAVLKRRPLSLPMVLVPVGALFAFLVPGIPRVDPLNDVGLIERVTEIGVLVSLLGSGLAIDRAPGWHRWAVTWRLLTIGMLATIVSVSALGIAVGFGIAPALLLAAALVPTDPVLAAEVQVRGPSVDGTSTGHEDQVRLSLTTEAGLNDGLAFPFVLAAIAVASGPHGSTDWVLNWVAYSLISKIAIGVGVGWASGRLIAKFVFTPPRRVRAIADTSEGFVAIGAILLVYGATELIRGYGFLAVFVAAVVLRNAQRDHEYHKILHDFTTQVEHLIGVGLLLFLGGSLAGGAIAGLTWRGVAVAAGLVFVVRPLSSRLALLGTRTTQGERRAIAFFGIRGFGSVYYVAYAFNHAEFDHKPELWAAVIFAVLLSVAVHGITATPAMRTLDRRRRRPGTLEARNQRKEIKEIAESTPG